MVRIGHPPRAAASYRLWRYTDIAARYAINLMLAAAILTAAIAAHR